jgi:hypothetical protein
MQVQMVLGKTGKHTIATCNKTPDSPTKLRINIVRIKPSHTLLTKPPPHFTRKRGNQLMQDVDDFRENRNTYVCYITKKLLIAPQSSESTLFR